ncbi:hypothetical protein KBD11_02130 [Candidatus Saccharibacteria bacterium]|nr:hypothetical protein [Candidatus Saccharibacteria bacterium]
MRLFARLSLVVVAAAGFVSFLLPPVLVGAVPTECPPSWQHLQKSAEPGDIDDRVCCPPNSQNDPDSYTRDCFFAKYLNPAIRLLSALAGLAVIIGIIVGGMQYSASGGDPQKAAAGKTKVVKSLYALVMFLFFFSIVQFLSPGGIGTKPIRPVPPGVAEQCSQTFLGVRSWFVYLPDAVFTDRDGVVSCNIENFELFGAAGDGKESYVLNVVLAVLDGLLRVAGLVAVAFVIVGGAKYITSQGEPEKSNQARASIINALIGLVIAIIATAVVSFVGNRLT